ncbi:hypothetical protein [Brevibacillus borstelensis]|nr:hypothetical protein [Brevibacillus borstelensis]
MIPISVHETQQSVEDDGVGMDDVFLQRILDRKADGRSGVGYIQIGDENGHSGTGLLFKSAVGTGATVTFRVHSRMNNK